jgi:epoxyqueuosine reductase QueG
MKIAGINDRYGMTMFDAITGRITRSIGDYEKANGLADMWREPVVKIISAKKVKHEWLKQAVAPDHLAPADILPDAKSVICFFIPFHGSVVQSNAAPGPASAEWALAYIKTNDLIAMINRDIEALLAENGYRAGKIPATHNFDETTLVSRWSHRHIAYLAGIGAFGINNMLITEKGCCGRIGSIVTNYEYGEHVPDTAHADTAPAEKCLNKINRSCGLCRKKCEAGAYPAAGFDRRACYAKCLENAELHKNLGFADVCGKCLAALPCSLAAPRL